MFKIRHIRLMLFISVLWLYSCEDRIGSNIPNVSFRVQINLNDPNYATLKISDGNAVTIDEYDRYGRRAGYKGLIIIRSFGEYYAFDRCCPHHIDIAHPADKIMVEADGALAICPHDSSSFDIISGTGAPTPSSVAKYPLKRYNTTLSGNDLVIYNN